jgi:hypothetical protein
MKQRLKHREIRGVQVLIKALTKIWDHLTFEDVHAVFSD